MANRTLKPLPAGRFDYWKAHHLLNRAGFGGTPSQVRALANLGIERAVDHVVGYADVAADPEGGAGPVTADLFDANIMRPPTEEEQRMARIARRTGDEATLGRIQQERQRRQRADREQIAALQRWWLRRMIETPRPLEEKMTLFWHGHFATGYRAIEDSYHMFLQNQLFRAHAVGDFRQLVHGIIRDPAMLRYLNNDRNRRQHPNENLARELMELFTLGEGNGYAEEDIKEGARALTGYTFDDDAFAFEARQHDDGSKRILGHVGAWDGDDFVEIILSKRFVSEFICLKLYRFFVNDLPHGPTPDAVEFVTKLAKRFRESEYRLGPLLRTLFRAEHFYDEANVGAQIKSPVQLIVQTIRAMRTPARSLDALLNAADLMGQDLFYPPSVKGWDGGRAWIATSTLFVRQNLVIYMLTGRRPDAYAWEADGTAYDATHLIEHLEGGADGDGAATRRALTYLLRFALGRPPHAERVDTLARFVADAGGRLDNAVLVGLLSLIAAMPEYQLC